MNFFPNTRYRFTRLKKFMSVSELNLWISLSKNSDKPIEILVLEGSFPLGNLLFSTGLAFFYYHEKIPQGRKKYNNKNENITMATIKNTLPNPRFSMQI